MRQAASPQDDQRDQRRQYRQQVWERRCFARPCASGSVMALQFPALRRLIVLAEELHFGRAAARLNMTQPALTRSIQALEESVGTRLFTRATKREVTLTPAGRQLAADAQVLLNDLARAHANSTQAAGLGPVSLRLAISPALFAGRTARGLARFGKANPYLTMVVEMVEVEPAKERLRTGEFDLAIVHAFGLSVEEDLIAQRLWADRFLWVVGASHPLAMRESVTEVDEVSWPYALYSGTSNLSNLQEFARQRGLPDAPVSIRSMSCALLRSVLLEGGHIGVVSEETFNQDIAQGLIVPLRGRGPTRDISVVALSRRGGVRHAAVDALVGELTETPGSTEI